MIKIVKYRLEKVSELAEAGVATANETGLDLD